LATTISELFGKFLDDSEKSPSAQVDTSHVLYNQLADQATTLVNQYIAKELKTITDPQLQEKYKELAKTWLVEIDDICKDSDKNFNWKRRQLTALLEDIRKINKDLIDDYNRSQSRYDSYVRERDSVYNLIMKNE